MKTFKIGLMSFLAAASLTAFAKSGVKPATPAMPTSASAKMGKMGGKMIGAKAAGKKMAVKKTVGKKVAAKKAVNRMKAATPGKKTGHKLAMTGKKAAKK